MRWLSKIFGKPEEPKALVQQLLDLPERLRYEKYEAVLKKFAKAGSTVVPELATALARDSYGPRGKIRNVSGNEEDDNDRKRQRVIEALAYTKSAEAIDPLVRVLETASFPPHRERAADALAKLGDQRALPVLRKRLSDRSEPAYVRRAVEEAIAALERNA